MDCIPFAHWDELKPIYDELVWCARLDGRYQVEVQRIDGDKNTAVFCIFDHQENMHCILNMNTALAYGAAMGPDSADVLRWMDMAEKAAAAHQSYQ